MGWQWLILRANLFMEWGEWPAGLRFPLVVVPIMPCEMCHMVISALKDIFRGSLTHGDSFTFTPLLPMILQLIPAILFYTFYMGVVKMKEAGPHKEKQI